MALNVEQTHQHFENGFTQRNKRRNHHHNISFRERCTGPVKLHWKADGLAIAGRYGTHINTRHFNASSCLSFKTRLGFPTQDNAYARAEEKVAAITTWTRFLYSMTSL